MSKELSETFVEELQRMIKASREQAHLLGTLEEKVRLTNRIPEIIDLVVNEFVHKGGPAAREKTELALLHLITGKSE